MSLLDQINKSRDQLRQGEFTSEASVSQGLLLPMLHALGWPVFDTSIVIPEYSVENRRVDFALCHPSRKPSVFIEVKKVGSTDGADRQLFEYAFHEGVPMAILMDGQEWSFYLPGEQGKYDDRRVYKLDVLTRSPEEALERLERYLSYSRVCSGESLISARSDYKNVARAREVKAILPKAWMSLLKEQDSLLLDLLAEKAEDLCGYKPDLDKCSQFLAEFVSQGFSILSKESEERRTPVNVAIKRRAEVYGIEKIKTPKKFTLKFKDNEFKLKSARAVMLKLFELLAREDPSFLDRFASRKHGKKRRYLAKDKYELYPGRPDLANDQSAELVPGWWMGTNYSHRSIKQIIDLGLEVAGPEISAQVQLQIK